VHDLDPIEGECCSLSTLQTSHDQDQELRLSCYEIEPEAARNERRERLFV
jgi:hypothetical protein